VQIVPCTHAAMQVSPMHVARGCASMPRCMHVHRPHARRVHACTHRLPVPQGRVAFSLPRSLRLRRLALPQVDEASAQQGGLARRRVAQGADGDLAGSRIAGRHGRDTSRRSSALPRAIEGRGRCVKHLLSFVRVRCDECTFLFFSPLVALFALHTASHGRGLQPQRQQHLCVHGEAVLPRR
jgi:hypothetical protein